MRNYESTCMINFLKLRRQLVRYIYIYEIINLVMSTCMFPLLPVFERIKKNMQRKKYIHIHI